MKEFLLNDSPYFFVEQAVEERVENNGGVVDCVLRPCDFTRVTNSTQDVPDDQNDEGEPTHQKHSDQYHYVLCCFEIAWQHLSEQVLCVFTFVVGVVVVVVVVVVVIVIVAAVVVGSGDVVAVTTLVIVVVVVVVVVAVVVLVVAAAAVVVAVYIYFI